MVALGWSLEGDRPWRALTMAFPCNRCGACCRLVGCRHLVDCLCEIYEERPLVCRVDEMWERHFQWMPPQIWLSLNQEACRLLLGAEKDVRNS